MINQCPLCRQRITTNVHGQDWQKASHFNMAVSSPFSRPNDSPLPIGDYYRKQPARQANFVSDVLVPLSQSAITGIIGGLSSGVIASLIGYNWLFSSKAGLIIGLGFFGLFWFRLLGLHNELLWIIESITNTDIDHDGSTGKPQAIQLEVIETQTDHYHKSIVDLPEGIKLDSFIDFCLAITRKIAPKSLAESVWCGRGKPFSKPKYTELLSVLMGVGFIKWVDSDNHAQGREVTAKGKASLGNWAKNARNHTQASSD